MMKLPQTFFAKDTLTVAKQLLGKVIEVDGVRGRIVETEAYTDDGASHGKTRTERSALMHDTHGYVYVYLIYGMYNCLNFTTDKNHVGAVLVRAIEPLNKIGVLKKRRGTDKITNLCSGPGKLCQALNITKRTHNDTKIGDKIKVFDDGYIPKDILATSRIGIKQDLHLKWRFLIKDNLHVTKAKLNK